MSNPLAGGVLGSNGSSDFETLSIGQAISLASLLEASAPKPGNVHRGADFSNTTFYDFAVSAVAIGNVFEHAGELSVGELVYKSIAATKHWVGTNTNLGMVLLFAPLAKTDFHAQDNDLGFVLSQLTFTDCQNVFAGISLASAGGLGDVEEMDVNSYAPKAQAEEESESPSDRQSDELMKAMKLAEDRDAIAKQYCNGFDEIQNMIAPMLLDAIEKGESLPDAIVYTHLKTMAVIPDSLIARKCGVEIATQSSVIAAQVVECIGPDRQQYNAGLADLDFWLRSDGNRRNPGTTADLIAASLFLLLRKNLLSQSVIQQGLNAARDTQVR